MLERTYAFPGSCTPEAYARRSVAYLQAESGVNPFRAAGRAQPPTLVIGHPLENPFTAAWAARDGQVCLGPLNLAARAVEFAARSRHPALTGRTVGQRSSRSAAPFRSTGCALPKIVILIKIDRRAAPGAPWTLRGMFMRPGEIRFNLFQLALRASFAQPGFQPGDRQFFAFAVIASAFAVTERKNVRGDRPGAIRAGERYPMVLRQGMPQTARALTNCTLVTPVFQRPIPILRRKQVG